MLPGCMYLSLDERSSRLTLKNGVIFGTQLRLSKRKIIAIIYNYN